MLSQVQQLHEKLFLEEATMQQLRVELQQEEAASQEVKRQEFL